jgi:hypothetical protein
MTACPGCLAMGINEVKKCLVRKIKFCTGLTREAKAGQNSIVSAQQAQRTNQGRTPFICTPRAPICISFKIHQVPPLSGLSGFNSVGYPSLVNSALLFMYIYSNFTFQKRSVSDVHFVSCLHTWCSSFII